MDKLAINLKAAKLCGYEYSIYPDNAQVYTTKTDKKYLYNEVFDIFASPADREATVIALGEKHATDIEANWNYDDDGNYKEFTGWYYCSNMDLPSKSFKTYTEAISAAVEACDEV